MSKASGVDHDSEQTLLPGVSAFAWTSLLVSCRCARLRDHLACSHLPRSLMYLGESQPGVTVLS